MIYTRTQEVFKRLFDMKNGSNSRVVLERQKEISKLESDANKVLEEINAATKECTSLQATLRAITKQYENLKELIKGKKTFDYEEINRELQITFDPTALRKELEEKYPGKKQELTEKITKFEEEIKTKNEEVTKLKSEVEEKSLQMSTILEKQKEMVELLKKSINGDLLNFSPRPIIDTLKFLNFNDEEAKILASNLIFSNPDFVSYYKSLEEAEKPKEVKKVVIEPTQKEEKPLVEENKEEIVVGDTKYSDEVIDVFKVDKEENKKILKEAFNVTDADLEEYSDLLETNVKEEVDKLKSANIDLNSLSLIVLNDVDNFVNNVKSLGNVSNADLVKYSAKLTLLPNEKVKKYINDYKVVYRYPQGNLYLGVFDLSEDVVSENSKGLNQVDSKFFIQYPQFQTGNCDVIANVIHTCKINNLEYQDKEGNYYMFVFDTKEFNKMYPDVRIVSYKG